MLLELGNPVHCTDGPCGELGDVVVDPRRRRVTHLVVQPRHRHYLARLVPIDLVAAGEGSAAIGLRCTSDELLRLEPVGEFAYLRLGELPLRDPDWEVGIETVLAHPYYDSPVFGDNAFDVDPHVAIAYDRIPKGQVEIRRASLVLSADDRMLGHVDGFLVDADEGITHVVLERGHVLGRRDVTIPVGDVESVTTDSIRLRLTKHEVAALASVPVHRWVPRLTASGRPGGAATKLPVR